MKYVVVLCLLLVLVQRASAQSYTFNFPFTSIRQYGVGHGTDEFVMRNPYDFVLDGQGNPFVSDIDPTQNAIFRFYSTFLNNFNQTNTSALGQIYSFQRNGNSFYALAKQAGQNNIYSTVGFQSGIKFNAVSVGLDPRGIVFDQAANTLYVSDFQNDTIYAYNLDDFSLRRTIGGSGAPTASTLDGPFRMALDRTGLWVADQINNRVLHFPFNSGVADIVIGQNDFGVNAQGNASNPLTTLRPYSVAFENTTNTLYISDATGRIFRYVGPFSTGQNASGVLDTANDLGSQNVITLKTFVYADGSIRLFFLDNANEKVISGLVRQRTNARRGSEVTDDQ